MEMLSAVLNPNRLLLLQGLSKQVQNVNLHKQNPMHRAMGHLWYQRKCTVQLFDGRSFLCLTELVLLCLMITHLSNYTEIDVNFKMCQV